VYQGFIAPIALYSILGFAVWRSWRRQGLGKGGEE
jgi:hypothetical protein